MCVDECVAESFFSRIQTCSWLLIHFLERGGKHLENHEFLGGDSFVSFSPLRYHKKEQWVFSSLSVCVCVEWEFLLLNSFLSRMERFIHVCFFAPALVSFSNPKTLHQVISDFVFYQHFLSHCLLPYSNSSVFIFSLHLLFTQPDS